MTLITTCISLIFLSSVTAGPLLLEKGLAVIAGNPTWSLMETTRGPMFSPCRFGFLLLRPPVLGISLPLGTMTELLSRGSTSLAKKHYCRWVGFLRWQLCITLSESSGCQSHIVLLAEVAKASLSECGATGWSRGICAVTELYDGSSSCGYS